jgi:hypothetical protein
MEKTPDEKLNSVHKKLSVMLTSFGIIAVIFSGLVSYYTLKKIKNGN